MSVAAGEALAALPAEPATTQRRIECPKCGIVMRLPDPVDEVAYPDDLELVEEIVTGSFRSVEHFCHARIATLTPAAVTDRSRRAVIVVGDAPAPAGWAVERVADHPGLSDALGRWLMNDANTLLRTLLDGSFNRLAVPDRSAALTPARLLSLPLNIAARRAAGAPADQIEDIEWIYDELVTFRIGWLVDDLADRSRLTDLPAALRRSIPRRCLGDHVLAELTKRGDEINMAGPDDGAAYARAFRAELTAAAAYRLAGRPNPREARFAALLVHLWTLSRSGDAQVDDEFFLDGPTLRATVGPEALLTAATVEAGRGGESATWARLREFEDRYAPLMDRAGYSRAFREVCATNQAALIGPVVRAPAADLAATIVDSVRRPLAPDGVDPSYLLGASAGDLVALYCAADPPRGGPGRRGLAADSGPARRGGRGGVRQQRHSRPQQGRPGRGGARPCRGRRGRGR